MADTTGTTPQTCALCRAPRLKKDEPDGVPRCFGHSLDPVNVARRAANAARGAAVAAKNKGVPMEKRAAVLSGAVPVELARRDAQVERRIAKIQEAADDAEPIDLTSKAKVLAFVGRAAGRLMAGVDGKEAQAASALARTALAALGIDVPEDSDETETPRGFSYSTTAGAPVVVRGRDTGAN